MFQITFLTGAGSAALIFLTAWSAISFMRKASEIYSDEINKKESLYRELEHRYGRVEAERARLDEEVFNIGRLFDISKKMSQSLRFEDIFLLLSQFLKEHFYFSKVELVLLNGMRNAAEGPVIKAAYEVDRDGNVNNVPADKLPSYDKMTEAVRKNKKPLFEGASATVPLVVEQKVIAVLSAKGLEKKDFERFLILASQFALQIKKVALYEYVQTLSITDGLTGAYRRRYFADRLKEELERSERLNLECSLLIIDIDHFKKCNDTYGHLAGDVALKEMASVVKKNVREVDLIARFGGEEFYVVLPETGPEGALRVAERIRKAVADCDIRAYDETFRLTVSIGISGFPKDSKGSVDLADKADRALYMAKETGRNRVVSYRQ